MGKFTKITGYLTKTADVCCKGLFLTCLGALAYWSGNTLENRVREQIRRDNALRYENEQNARSVRYWERSAEFWKKAYFDKKKEAEKYERSANYWRNAYLEKYNEQYSTNANFVH